MLLIALAGVASCGADCPVSSFHSPMYCIPTGPVLAGATLSWVVHDQCTSHLTTDLACEVSVGGGAIDLSLRETTCPGVTTTDCVDRIAVCTVPPLAPGSYAITMDGHATSLSVSTGGEGASTFCTD